MVIKTSLRNKHQKHGSKQYYLWAYTR